MKAKTHSGLKKRVKVTARGKFIFKKACRNHLLIHKSKGQKRGFKKGFLSSSADAKSISSLLHI